MKENSPKAPNVAMAQGHRSTRVPRRTGIAAGDAREFDRADVLIAARRVANRTVSVAPPPAPPTVRAPERYRPRTWRGSRGARVAAAILGVSLVGGAAVAATNWIVGLTAGSSGEGQSATIQNLTIAAVASPSASNQLYPGGTGDVVLTISNPNPYPVTVTGVNLPTSSTYATGYTSSALTTTQTGCLSTTPSDVIWSFSGATSGSAHTLTTPLTVGPIGNANNPLTVTLTNDASMTAAAPAACAGVYFSLPSLAGVAASGGSASVTTSPVVDAWTS